MRIGASTRYSLLLARRDCPSFAPSMVAPKEKSKKEKVLVWVHTSDAGEDLFLLLRTNPDRGEFWQPVTGSVEPGEKVEAAAARELLEETGLKADSSPELISAPYEFTSRWGNLVREYAFLVHVGPSQRTRVHLDGKEHSTFQWSTADSALELLKYESNARVLREVVQKLKQRKGE
jgi:8-oxo-dGTP pyrophosphatase MutT (NUDIX family)